MNRKSGKSSDGKGESRPPKIRREKKKKVPDGTQSQKRGNLVKQPKKEKNIEKHNRLKGVQTAAKRKKKKKKNAV